MVTPSVVVTVRGLVALGGVFADVSGLLVVTNFLGSSAAWLLVDLDIAGATVAAFGWAAGVGLAPGLAAAAFAGAALGGGAGTAFAAFAAATGTGFFAAAFDGAALAA